MINIRTVAFQTPSYGNLQTASGSRSNGPEKCPLFLSALAIENSLRCLEWTWTLNNIEIYRNPMVSLEKKTATEGFSICFPYIYNNVLICTRGYHRSCEEFKKYPVWYLCSLGIYWIQQLIFGIIANDCRHSKGNFTIGYTFAQDEHSGNFRRKHRSFHDGKWRNITYIAVENDDV